MVDRLRPTNSYVNYHHTFISFQLIQVKPRLAECEHRSKLLLHPRCRMLSAECANSTTCNSILTTFQAPNPSYSSYCGVLPAPQSNPPTHFMPLQSMARLDCLFRFDTMHPSPTVHQISAWIHLACRVPKRPLRVRLLSTTKGANRAVAKKAYQKLGEHRS